MWRRLLLRGSDGRTRPCNRQVRQRRGERGRGPLGLGLALALVCLIGAGMSAAAAAGQPAPAADQTYQSVRDSQPYAKGGSQVCLGCHNTAAVDDILQTPMGVAADSHTPMGERGCESCHGPSGYHAQLKMVDGKLILPPILFSKPKVDTGVGASPAAVQDKVCMGCHQGDMPINWMGSPHQRAQLSCATCHTVHALKDAVLVRQTQPKVCFTCHQDIRAMSYEYSHHPIREGKVVCADCHNPMGGHGRYQLKEFTVNQTCYQCHADKRGPFLWEHQPVRDNCTNCHTPHGSNQVRLLKQPQNFLCASCHSAVDDHMGGTFGGAGTIPGGNQFGTPFVSSMLSNQRACLNCHSQIHGSNSPAGEFFFR